MHIAPPPPEPPAPELLPDELDDDVEPVVLSGSDEQPKNKGIAKVSRGKSR